MRPVCPPRFSALLLLTAAAFASSLFIADRSLAADDLYTQQLRGVLRERCVACHGALSRKANCVWTPQV
ncbi:MAG UNVERIFIED_CONTAM: hypothetical protein LVR18_50440 [Planctomycetaceae bacterium]|jgi:mono/diheme cytochrome c family protein